MKNTRKNMVKNLSAIDIREAFTEYLVDTSRINAAAKERLLSMGYDINPWLAIPGADIAALYSVDNDIYSAVDGYAGYFDEDGFGSTLESVIKRGESYLVFAVGCRWNGASGYKIADSLEDAFSRDYDATIMLSDVSRGGKTMVCRESSHDVPMGSTTYVISLTTREAARLENADFSMVEKFAKHCAARV